MNPPFSGVFNDLDRVLLDRDQIQCRVDEMAEQIQAAHANQTITVVALMDGALFFVADLVRRIDLPIRLITLSASSYHGGTESSGSVDVSWNRLPDLKGQHLLLLDDILDTGRTLSLLRSRLLEAKPASLQIGVLLSKRRTRVAEVPVDYVGFEIDDEFVVGYGMDYQARFRNLPCIGVLEPSSPEAA